MEVTPQALRDVTFRSQRKGYDCDQVDDFLERVEAGIAALQERLDEATHRASAATKRVRELEARNEKLAAKNQGDEEADESLRRTLVLAQRTADAAVKEAKEEAARVRGEADEHAARVRAEADARVARSVREAEDEAKRGAVETRQRLVQEIIELEAMRDGVRADVATLERHHDEQKLRLRAAVAELQRMLDDPAALRGMPMPELREVALPEDLQAELEGPGQQPEDEPDVELGADTELEADTELDAEADLEVAEPEADDALLDEDSDDEPDDVRVDDEDDELVGDDDVDIEVDGDADIWGPDDESEPAPVKGRIGLFDDLEEDPLHRRDDRTSDSGPPTEALHIPEGPEGDDAYLAELRKAMLAADDDNDELPPLPPLSDEPLTGRRPRTRFGRRR